MIPLESNLVQRTEDFDQVRNYLHNFEFTLGGNWDYEHGFFDRFLDEGHKVWLRIPFEVTHGMLDGDSDANDAVIQIGTPFVLKHVYNEGLDKEGKFQTVGALVNQFQDPLDQDASVEEKWVEKAQSLLNKVENKWLQ